MINYKLDENLRIVIDISEIYEPLFVGGSLWMSLNVTT